MQIACVSTSLKATQDLEFQRRSIVAEKSEGLVGVDCKDHVVKGLAGVVGKYEHDPLTCPSYFMHRGAKMQSMSSRETTLERVDVGLRSVSE